MLSSEAIDFNIVRIELSNSFIVKLYPFIFCFFDVAEIVAELSTSIM